MGANDMQTVKAFLEAEAYDGPSLIIAYSHCIAHGYDMAHGLDQQKLPSTPATGRCSATTPTLATQGKNPFQLDSKRARASPLEELHLQRDPLHHAGQEQSRSTPKSCSTEAEADVASRWKLYEHMSHQPANGTTEEVKK